MHQNKKLAPSLSLFAAVGLALTMVVGSGLLVLPGLAYARVGPAALYAWLVSAVAIAPVLVVFARLGARFPNAGGIAGFVQAAFGRPAGLAAEILILGAIPGGAGVAITAGQYFAVLWDGSQVALLGGSLLVLLTGAALNAFGARLSGKIQQILALVLVGLLAWAGLAALTLGHPEPGAGIAPPAAWTASLPAFGLVFFAFIGWELMAFTSEEFQNPRRDFPLMIAISYVLVLALYLLIAGAVQWLLAPSDPILNQAPIAGLLARVLGPLSGKFAAGLGFVLVLANFISLVWAFSRLIYSSAREGLLPQTFTSLSGPGRTPRRAVLGVVLAFSLLTAACGLGLVSLALLFELAGSCFFFSYILAVVSDLRWKGSLAARAVAILALALTCPLFLSFGWVAIYPLTLFLGGLLLSRLRARQPTPA